MFAEDERSQLRSANPDTPNQTRSTFVWNTVAQSRPRWRHRDAERKARAQGHPRILKGLMLILVILLVGAQVTADDADPLTSGGKTIKVCWNNTVPTNAGGPLTIPCSVQPTGFTKLVPWFRGLVEGCCGSCYVCRP